MNDAALNPDGSPDRTFGRKGRTSMFDTAPFLELMVQPDGKYTFVGYRFGVNGSQDHLVMARYVVAERHGRVLGRRRR